MVPGAVRIANEPGAPEWQVVVGARFVLALPSPVSRAVVDGAASAAHVAEIEELISRILLGPDGVDGFALAWWPSADAPVTAVVRGTPVLELSTADGPRRLESRGIRPWHLAEFRDVHAVRIGPDSADRAWLTASSAAPDAPSFRATHVEWRSEPSPEPSAGRTAVDAHAPATEPIPLWAAAERDESAGALRTRDRDAVGAAGRFRVDGGEPRTVTGAVLIGRRPASPRIPREDVELVTVSPSATAVSATHLELRREGARLVATDLRSTNGTVVRTASGSRRMRSGESIVVVAGAVLELGGDTIVEILPPRQDQAHPDRQVPA